MLCRHEYGEAALTLELVDSMDEAIDHIHANGSGHTEAIITGQCYKSRRSACRWLPRGRQRSSSLACRAASLVVPTGPCCRLTNMSGTQEPASVRLRRGCPAAVQVRVFEVTCKIAGEQQPLTWPEADSRQQ